MQAEGRRLAALVAVMSLSVVAQARAQAPADASGNSGPATDAAPIRLTLEEAVSRAAAVDPAVIQAKGNVEIAEAAHLRSFGAYLPSLSGSVGTSLSSTERIDPTTNTTVTGSRGSLTAGASVSWDLFTGFRRSAVRAQTQAGRVASKADLEQQARDTRLAVTRAFFEALSAGRLVDVHTARIERAKVALAAAEKRAQVGSATRSDVLRAQLELNQARTAEAQARTQQRAAELQLGALVGYPGPVRPDGAVVAAAGEGAGTDGTNALDLDAVVASSPITRAAEASLTSAAAGVQAARAAYFPRLGLSAGYDYFAPTSRLIEGTTGWSVRLGLSIPIFDGFVREESVTRARVQQTVAAAQLEELRRSLRAGLERAADQVRLTRERLTLAAEALEVAREDLRVQQERYALGVSTMLDLLTSQENLVQAETALVSAQLDLEIARAELDALAGGGRS